MPTPLVDITGKRCHWLLDVRIGGSDYRYADENLEILDRAGNTLTYFAGLGDLTVDLDDSPTSVAITLPGYNPDGVSWARIVASGGPAALGQALGTLRRIYEDQTIEEARVMVSSPVTSPEHGGIDEVLTFSLERVGDEGGNLFPPATAIVNETTWPVTANLQPDPSVTNACYPWIFGYPGLDGSGRLWAGTSIYLTASASPAYCIEYNNGSVNYASSKLIIAGHKVLQTSVTVEDVSGSEGYADPSLLASGAPSRAWSIPRSNVTVTHMDDGRGREVAVVTLGSLSSAIVEFLPGHEYWVTWYPETPGPAGGLPNVRQDAPMRGAGEILEYLLKETGTRVDAGRMAATRVFFDQFHIDTAITEQINPREWLDEHIGTFVPYIWREGEDGVYITLLNYGATKKDSMMNLVESLSTSATGVPVVRTSPLTQSDPREVVNDLTVRFAPRRGEELLGAIRLSAAGVVTLEGVADPNVEGELPTLLCTSSQARYGRWAAEEECWIVAEVATATALASSYIQWKSVARRALTVTGGLELDSIDIGSIVTYTEDALYLNDAAAIVTAMSLGIDDVELTLELLDSPLTNSRAQDAQSPVAAHATAADVIVHDYSPDALWVAEVADVNIDPVDTTWRDHTGNGRTMTTLTGTAPTFTASDSDFGYRPSTTFAGGYLATTTTFADDDLTVLVVQLDPSVTGSEEGATGGYYTDNMWLGRATSVANTHIFGVIEPAPPYGVTFTMAENVKPHVLIMTRDGALREVFVDGVSVATASGRSAATTTARTWKIGGGMGGGNFGGKIAMCARWTRALTSTEIVEISTLLRSWYGGQQP